jgi:hypothetical protein
VGVVTALELAMILAAALTILIGCVVVWIDGRRR